MKILNLKFKIPEYQTGSLLIYTAVIIFIFSLVMLGVLTYATTQLRTLRGSVNGEVAFQIAEAGANYYQWHLAHFASDYYDGNASTTPGPYVHNYTDKDTNTVVGKFSLNIIPPPPGSTVVTIKSTGSTLVNPNQTKTVTTRYGVPSLAQYAFLTNSDAWIGPTESVSGPFFTNGGVRFDGTGNAPIYSAKSTYTCQSWSGSPCPANKPGIWGSAPASTQAFWQFPVPNVDFSTITSDLAAMKSSAQSAGIYLAPSNAQGYLLLFKADGTIDISKVTSLVSGEPTGWDVKGVAHNNSTDYNNKTFLFNKPIPQNGIIYIEDNAWVEGTVKGRAIVAAAKLPQPAAPPSILVKNSIVYAAKDGTNSLGMLAQGDFLTTYQSADTLEIDGAIIAQTGSTQHYAYAQFCNSTPKAVKTRITIYGALASFGTWTWSWTNCAGTAVISGYTNTSTTYDASLLYSPPPSFPLSSSGYQQISWTSN